MANVCSFSMCVVGAHSDIEKFYNAMSQKGNVYMGRGASADIVYEDDESRAFIDGWCKWSIHSSLEECAISMRMEPEVWHWGDVDAQNLQFVTMMEACEKWNLDVEVYSEEPGCCFQEHYVCRKGKMVCSEIVSYEEYCIDDYETKEEAEKELCIVITDDEWDSGDTYISRGGFGEWHFEI